MGAAHIKTVFLTIANTSIAAVSSSDDFIKSFSLITTITPGGKDCSETI